MVEEHNRYKEEEKELEEEMQESEEKEETSKENKNNKKKNKKEKNKKEEKVEVETEEEVVEEVIDEKYEALMTEIAQLKDSLLRNQAELENFKRRTNEERIKERKYALKDFLLELISVIDVLESAINVKTDDEKVQKFLKGFVMINVMFKQILEKEGVVKIEALNKPFDPNYHNAIEMVQVEGVESNIITEELQAGYMYKDRVLRPSMVKVNQ